jgi:hypothetical protein
VLSAPQRLLRRAAGDRNRKAVSRSDLLALARKYRWLAELRRARCLGSELDETASLRQVAQEFPGALRELDQLPLPVIDARILALELAAATGAVEPWMEWMHAYHELMRLSLTLKRALGGRRDVDDRVAEELVVVAREQTGLTCAVEFVRAVATPPDGRLNRLVLAELALRFGAQASAIHGALFPRLEESQL